jgi:hypothetical protein
LQSSIADNVDSNPCRSAPSSPSKRQHSILDTPIQSHFSNKENWDPVLKLYSTDRQKKYRSISTCSVTNERTPLQDITSLFQARLAEANAERGGSTRIAPLPGPQNQLDQVLNTVAPKVTKSKSGLYPTFSKLGDKSNRNKEMQKTFTVVKGPAPTQPILQDASENIKPVNDTKKSQPSSHGETKSSSVSRTLT